MSLPITELKTVVPAISRKIVQEFQSHRYHKTFSLLLELVAVCQEEDPVLFHPSFLDLLTDKEAWYWVFRTAPQDVFSTDEILALKLIVDDVKEREKLEEFFAS